MISQRRIVYYDKLYDEWVTCRDCGRVVANQDPTTMDDEAWEYAAVIHAPDCLWLRTRAYVEDATPGAGRDATNTRGNQ